MPGRVTFLVNWTLNHHCIIDLVDEVHGGSTFTVNEIALMLRQHKYTKPVDYYRIYLPIVKDVCDHFLGINITLFPFD